MKSLSIIVALFLLAAGSCNRQTKNHSSSTTQDSVPKRIPTNLALNDVVAIDSLPGFSVRMKDSQIWLYKDQQLVLWTHANFIPSSAIHARSELDSAEIEREWAASISLNPPLGDADNCDTRYAIDSVVQYTNKYHLRCLTVRVRDTTECTDGEKVFSQFKVRFLTVSKLQTYCQIYYFDFAHTTEPHGLINDVFNAIKIRE